MLNTFLHKVKVPHKRIKKNKWPVKEINHFQNCNRSVDILLFHLFIGCELPVF
jgi:hypothetical protein